MDVPGCDWNEAWGEGSSEWYGEGRGDCWCALIDQSESVWREFGRNNGVGLGAYIVYIVHSKLEGPRCQLVSLSFCAQLMWPHWALLFAELYSRLKYPHQLTCKDSRHSCVVVALNVARLVKVQG